MNIDVNLINRMKKILSDKKITFVEKRMFGGVAFMINGNMAIGTMHDGKLMARVGPEQNDKALELPGAAQMQMHKPAIGYIVVKPENVAIDSDLEIWIDMSLSYNKVLPAK